MFIQNYGEANYNRKNNKLRFARMVIRDVPGENPGQNFKQRANPAEELLEYKYG